MCLAHEIPHRSPFSSPEARITVDVFVDRCPCCARAGCSDRHIAAAAARPPCANDGRGGLLLHLISCPPALGNDLRAHHWRGRVAIDGSNRHIGSKRVRAIPLAGGDAGLKVGPPQRRGCADTRATRSGGFRSAAIQACTSKCRATS